MMVKITLRRVLLMLCGLVAAGFGIAASGLVPIAASSGHWKITEWFLHWTMRNSARTYSAVQTAEHVRDDRGLVSAAGHFRQACQVCHGAPGEPPSPVMQAATPPAPDLGKTAGQYSDRELFWIIRHGVKYTGMPAWPASGRDDEVRRMVGFVRRLGTITPQQYRNLTEPRLAGGAPSAAAGCAGCHGPDGMGRGQPDVPIIAGQNTAYIAEALRQYRAGTRRSAVMQTAAAGLDEGTIRTLAAYYAGLEGLRRISIASLHPLAAHGLPESQLPACASCHAEGKAAPVIAGQRPDYLVERLRQWRGEDTVIDAHKPRQPMPVIARRIPARDIEELARALSQAPPRRR